MKTIAQKLSGATKKIKELRKEIRQRDYIVNHLQMENEQYRALNIMYDGIMQYYHIMFVGEDGEMSIPAHKLSRPECRNKVFVAQQEERDGEMYIRNRLIDVNYQK